MPRPLPYRCISIIMIIYGFGKIPSQTNFISSWNHRLLRKIGQVQATTAGNILLVEQSVHSLLAGSEAVYVDAVVMANQPHRGNTEVVANGNRTRTAEWQVLGKDRHGITLDDCNTRLTVKSDTVAVLAVLPRYPRYYRGNGYNFYGITAVLWLSFSHVMKIIVECACKAVYTLSASQCKLWRSPCSLSFLRFITFRLQLVFSLIGLTCIQMLHKTYL